MSEDVSETTVNPKDSSTLALPYQQHQNPLDINFLPRGCVKHFHVPSPHQTLFFTTLSVSHAPPTLQTLPVLIQPGTNNSINHQAMSDNEEDRDSLADSFDERVCGGRQHPARRAAQIP
jgi:hypothetical protein